MTHSLLQRGDEMLTRAEDAFLALSSGVIVVLVLSAVFFRYFLSDPLTWTEEFVVILFTWMLFIGFSSGFRYRMHLRIDALLLVLPMRGRAVLGAVAVAVTLATLSGLAWFGTQQAWSMLHTQTPMLRVSAAWAASAVPVSALFGAVHVLHHALAGGLGQTLWPVHIGAAKESVHE